MEGDEHAEEDTWDTTNKLE
ncbi:uncharacterized protein G2W53_023890 [Senna tora]|uniref:Uncharacterized protein n=1 Tax=Senna tora TaxID=362788 RepID=A0A834WCL8_9FABA|nr:uncharacterized protein G2W53_023890 [Senna tora]